MYSIVSIKTIVNRPLLHCNKQVYSNFVLPIILYVLLIYNMLDTAYRAPELFDVQSDCVIDAKTDVWSLGCTLYAMAYGMLQI